MSEWVKIDRDWSFVLFVGPFAFDEAGIFRSVVRPSSAAGFGVFVISTFDGDFLCSNKAGWQRDLRYCVKRANRCWTDHITYYRVHPSGS